MIRRPSVFRFVDGCFVSTIVRIGGGRSTTNETSDTCRSEPQYIDRVLEIPRSTALFAFPPLVLISISVQPSLTLECSFFHIWSLCFAR